MVQTGRRDGAASSVVARKLSLDDMVQALAAGVRDFCQAPQFGLFFGLLYAAAGWLLVALLWRLEAGFLVYPLAMGFALIAPFAASGLYAISDRLERGLSLSWRTVFGAVGQAARGELRWMALITGFALVVWMDIAAFLFFAFMGFSALEGGLLSVIFTTPNGLIFLLIGHVAGALIALLVFSISAVSFPMLYERDIDFVTAMVASVRLVLVNPVPMIAWCGLIAILVGLSLASIFVGMIVVLPIIGHATWHLYRRAIETDAPMRPR